MIDLSVIPNEKVAIQLKRAVVLIASDSAGRLFPTPMPSNDPNAQQAPIITDLVIGAIRKQGEQWLLSYGNPANHAEQMEMAIDPENVLAVWTVRKITIVASAS